MKALIPVVAAAACMLAAPAFAEVYGSAGYSAITTSEDDLDLSMGAITGRIGTTFTPNLGVEGEASFGVAEDTATVMGVDVDLKVKTEYAAYVVGFVPLGENFQLLGRVGFGGAEVEASSGSVSISDSGSGVHYGVGAQYFFSANHGIRADYTRLESVSANMFTISYAFRFK